MQTHRATDTPEFTRIIESDLARANLELAALSCSFAAMTTEISNLRHQNYAQAVELAKLRKMYAASISDALLKECSEDA